MLIFIAWVGQIDEQAEQPVQQSDLAGTEFTFSLNLLSIEIIPLKIHTKHSPLEQPNIFQTILNGRIYLVYAEESTNIFILCQCPKPIY